MAQLVESNSVKMLISRLGAESDTDNHILLKIISIEVLSGCWGYSHEGGYSSTISNWLSTTVYIAMLISGI